MEAALNAESKHLCNLSNYAKADITQLISILNETDDALSLCNCTDFIDCNYTVHPSFVKILYAFLFWTVIVVSVLGNATVIWIVLRHARMRTVTNYYLLNLAIADASISIFNTSFAWRQNINISWTFGEFYCHFNNTMGITPIVASVFTMIVMSIDRYWAVVHPLRKRPGKRATVSVIASIWILAILIGLPAGLAGHVIMLYWMNTETLEIAEHFNCYADNFPDGDTDSSKYLMIYTICVSVVQYALPLCVLTYTYWEVGGVLTKKESVGDVRHYRSIAAKKKASKMLALVVLLFMIVWLPYHAYFVLELTGCLNGVVYPETAMYLFLNIYLLGMSSTMFNPIIYYFMNKRFRIGFRYAFRWLPFVSVDYCEYACQLGSSCPRGTSIVPSYHSHGHTHTLTNTIVTTTDF